MNNRPLVTITLPCYNQERTIGEVLESALAQDYDPLEIVLSDDCSTDRTFEIAQEIAAGYRGPHKLVVHRNTHNCFSRGEPHQLDGLEHGELRVFGDGDDIHLPNQVSTLVAEWERLGRKPSLLCSNFEIIDDEGRHIGYGQPLGGESFYDDGTDPLPYREIPSGGCTIMYRYDDLRGAKSGFPQERKGIPAADLMLARRARLKGGVSYCNKVLLQYRLSAHNISQHRDAGREGWVRGEVSWSKKRLFLLDQYEDDVRALSRYTPEMAARIAAKRKVQYLHLDILQKPFAVGWLAIVRSFFISWREGVWSAVLWVRRWTGLLLKR